MYHSNELELLTEQGIERGSLSLDGKIIGNIKISHIICCYLNYSVKFSRITK